MDVMLNKVQLKSQAHSIAAVLGLAALPILVCGCGEPTAQSRANDSSSAPSVETVAVEERDLVNSVEIPGSVQGEETADLYSKVGGYLEEINVDIGDSVKKGQVGRAAAYSETEKALMQKEALVHQAEAEAAQSKAAITQAEAGVTSANAAVDEAKTKLREKRASLDYQRSDFASIKELVDSQAVREELLDQARSKQEAAEAALMSVEAHIRTADAQRQSAIANVDKAKADYQSALANVRVAQANLEFAKTHADYANIRAPFDGEVTRRWVDPGAFVQSADGNSAAKPILQVTRIDVVRVALDVSMSDVGALNRGDRVLLDRINVLPGKSFEGEVTRFSAGLHEQSRMMRVQIDLKNPDRELRPGYYGYVTLFLDELKGTPVIPSSALNAAGDEKFVFLVEGGVVRKRPVTTDYQDGTIVGIASGLKAGDKVVRAGGGQLSDGQKIKPSN